MKHIIYLFVLTGFSLHVFAEAPSGVNKGWTATVVDDIAVGCTEQLVVSAKQGYYNRAKEVGDTNPKPFPEIEIRKSMSSMCVCIVATASEKWSLLDFSQNSSVYFGSLLKDAMEGKRCKPTGIAGKAIDKARKRD